MRYAISTVVTNVNAADINIAMPIFIVRFLVGFSQVNPWIDIVIVLDMQKPDRNLRVLFLLQRQDNIGLTNIR